MDRKEALSMAEEILDMLVSPHSHFQENMHEYRDEIEWFFLVAYDKDYKEILRVWMIPGNLIDGSALYICLDNKYKYNVENMREHEITDKFKI